MKDISQVIPRGYNNRISRKRLAYITGQNDRTVRKQIEESEEAICHADGGYFIPDPHCYVDMLYANEYYLKENSRVNALNRKLNKIQRTLEKSRF